MTVSVLFSIIVSGTAVFIPDIVSQVAPLGTHIPMLALCVLSTGQTQVVLTSAAVMKLAANSNGKLKAVKDSPFTHPD